MKYDYINGDNSDEDPLYFFSLADLIRVAEKYPEHIFSFIGTGLHPVEINSWRGSYDIPSITYSAKAITGKELTRELTKGLTKTHYGYKGGEYMYGRNDVFYISNYGAAEEYKMVGYKVQGSSVILLTKIDKYYY